MDNLLEVINIKKYFPAQGSLIAQKGNRLKAVDGVSFALGREETLGLVGESGCGKTTLGRMVLRLIEPTEGEIHFEGKSILGLSKKEVRGLRKNMQIILQDPYGSLNPRMKAGSIIEEPLKIHDHMNTKERRQRVSDLL